MIIVYTPAGGEPEQYDVNTLRVSEASIVERTVGREWGDIESKLKNNDLDGMRGVIWVLRKRSNPSLRWADWDPGIREMRTFWDLDEVEQEAAQALKLLAVEEDVTAEGAEDFVRAMAKACVDRERAAEVIEAVITTHRETSVADPKEEPQAEPVMSPTFAPIPASPEPAPTGLDSSPTSSTSHPEPSMT
ncbi:hypothetical protein OG897_06145 [Streptomyces sp. NBC_00237]|uniref:hypothetical protein n=1 Tax=Streptomyces sp. NBC_00237 TaxID=2975687 RepID=UPI00224E79B0|nr:hypothetical protein [Streptomyces sp. NBC_00237]MCX5201042.1 hypothetical protein [Streptomyces sp. NBC_00237]